MTGSEEVPAGVDLTRDGFLGGRLWLWQPRRGYRAATDAVFLAAFVPARSGERVLDLGCGVGTAALCLARRVGGLELHGLELQPAYALLARRNAAENGVGLTVHEGDVCRLPEALAPAGFDQVFANPPFHHPGTAPAADAGRDRANREGAARLSDWVAAGTRLLAPGGTLTMIHRQDRLRELMAALGPDLGVQLLPLAPRTGRPAKRVLARIRVGTGVEMLPPFTVHAGDRHLGDGDDYSDAARAVLRAGMAIPVGKEGESLSSQG